MSERTKSYSFYPRLEESRNLGITQTATDEMPENPKSLRPRVRACTRARSKTKAAAIQINFARSRKGPSKIEIPQPRSLPAICLLSSPPKHRGPLARAPAGRVHIGAARASDRIYKSERIGARASRCLSGPLRRQTHIIADSALFLRRCQLGRAVRAF